jgi:hypothetical protein
MIRISFTKKKQRNKIKEISHLYAIPSYHNSQNAFRTFAIMNLQLRISLLLPFVAAVVGTGDVQLLMYETDVDQQSILKEQAATIPGIQATVVGSGTKFEGFGSKYEAVLPVLRSMDAETLVVLSDARDVLINDPLKSRFANSATSKAVQELREGFEALTSLYPGAIVASAEAQCCVGALTYAKPGDYFDEDGRRKERACYSGHPPCLWNGDDKVVPWDNFMKDLALQHMGIGEDVYLNAGLLIGKAGDMLEVFEMADFQVFEDDQAVLTDFMYRRPDKLILDYNQVIFGNNRHSTNGCMFQVETNDSRLIHMETGTTPFFIHSPGGYVSCHESLASRLGVKTQVGAEQRRKLQDWKRNLQNYPPVCNYVCPPNSQVKKNVQCLDTFKDCLCIGGTQPDFATEQCVPPTGPCDYVCPANSRVKSRVVCLDSFGDCKCNPGFTADSSTDTCVQNAEPPVCDYVCPANSKVKKSVLCLDDFKDCKCNTNFVADFATQTCVPIAA